MKVILCILLLFILRTSFASTQLNCPRNFYEKGSYFYIISDRETTSDTAQSTCISSSGNLVQTLDREVQSDLMQASDRRHIPSNLILVRIFQHPDNNNVFKYRPRHKDITVRDPEDISGWRRPGGTRMSSFRLYEGATDQFDTIQLFCYVSGRDITHRSVCDQGWNLNYELYGGTAETDDTITLYGYANTQANHLLSTNLFLRDDVNQTGLANETNLNVYIPDISIFAGPRSEIGQSNWFWNNGTMITDPTYPTSDTSICQQMTWPLTYRDGVNLRGKQCLDEAYYICQIKFEIEVMAEQCNGSVLTVTWNEINSQSITNEVTTFTFELRINGIVHPVAFNQTRYQFSNLTPRTSYNIEASVNIDGCDQFKVTTASLATTSYGVPLPVMNARVRNHTNTSSNCVIEWDRDQTDANILNYKIFLINGNESTSSIDVESSALSIVPEEEGKVAQDIELGSFRPGTRLAFQIQAFSCEGGNPVRDVTGSCLVPEAPAQMPNDFSPINIIVPVLAALVVILTILVFIYKKRKSNQKKITATSMPEISNQPTVYERPINVGQAVDETYVQPNSLQDYENFKHHHTYETVKSTTYENVA